MAASTTSARQQRAEARRLASLSTEELDYSTLKTEQQPTATIDNESKMEEEQPTKLETRQESKSNDDTPSTILATGDDSKERVPSPPSTVDGPTSIATTDASTSIATSTNDGVVNETNNKEVTKELQPAFNLQDIGTIQDQLVKEQVAEQTATEQSRGRPASRSSSMGREGRPASRASSNGRASPSYNGRASPNSSYNGSAVSRRGRSRSPVGLTPHTSSRSNSLSSRPTSRAGSLSRQGSVGRQGGRESAATIQASNNNNININSNNELSSAALAAGESAALYNANPLPYYNEPNFGHTSLPTGGRMEGRARSPSPVSRFPNTNSMSFEMSPNQSMSFGNLMGDSFDWGVGTSPIEQGGYNGQGGRGRSSSPVSQSRYPPPQDSHGYYNYPPPPMSQQSQAPPQGAPQVGGYNPSTGYHPNASGPSQYHGHYNSSSNQQGGQGSRRHSRSSSPVSGRNSNLPRRNSQQALFPEHHVHSPGRESQGGPQGSSSRSQSRSTSPIKKPRRSSPERSSVFRGNPTPGQTNLPQELLLALEEEDSDSNSPPNSPQPKKKVVKKKSGAKSKKKASTKSSTKSKSKGKGKKSRGKELPPSSSSSDALSSSNLALSSNPSMLLDSTQIDACLQDLSFRKSYELEQMFSFINTDGNGMGMSFNMGFSGEEGDDTKGYTPINSFSGGGGDNGGMVDGGMEYLSSPAKAPKSPKATSRDPPVVHTTPPSYGGGHHNQGSSYPSSSNGGMGYSANTHTPPPSSYENHPHHIPTSFPSKRIKVSTRHTLHPLALDLTKRGGCSSGEGGGDYFSLLRKLAPAFVGFRFKLPEMMEMSNVSGSNGSGNIVGQSSSHSTLHMTMIDENQMIIAKRRINSSICAFGGSLPPRTVSPTPSYTAVAQPPLLEESTEQRNERCTYESSLASRYFMKEHCISWDVELHEVIAPKAGSTPKAAGKKDKKATAASASATSTPKAKKKKEIGVFKAADAPGGGKYCAPVTPSSPPAEAPPSTPSTPSSTKTTKSKSKYRCKLCGLPKQNHKCTYKNQVVRSIGTMVYPAVNAFVSNEPGRLAPALSEMNNFTSLLSQDTTMTGSQSSVYGGPLYHNRGGMNLLTPDTSHWAPTTPGGLSTMSSSDPNSPATPHQASSRKRDHNHLMMSRTMSALSPGSRHHHPVVPHVPSMPPAPAGAIPNDVLFRDTMELKIQQYRTVGAVRSSDSKTTVSSLLSSPLSSVGGVAPHTPGMPPQSATPASSSVASSSAVTKAITESVTAYRYPQIPTPYTQRKEMGDTLFALSREVPNLADSCASILREARESDDWDQAVAELTTQVLIVLKCEEMDYTLDGLRRHLLGLGIAC